MCSLHSTLNFWDSFYPLISCNCFWCWRSIFKFPFQGTFCLLKVDSAHRYGFNNTGRLMCTEKSAKHRPVYSNLTSTVSKIEKWGELRSLWHHVFTWFPSHSADPHNTPTHSPWNSPRTDTFIWHILLLCFVLCCAVNNSVMSLTCLRAFCF